jgi:hypothetical protein
MALPGLDHVDFQYLNERYGHLLVYLSASSKTREDTTDADLGGLPEETQLLGKFLDALQHDRRERHD